MIPLVPLHPAALRCWPWLPQLSRVGRIHVGPLGELLRVREDGGADPVLLGGGPWHRSIACDPTAAGRARRYP